MKRLIIFLFVAIAMGFCLESSDLAATTSKLYTDSDTFSDLANGMKPNVLFIAIDDLNDWVGCMGGNPQVKTPNLDAFNSQGGMVMYNAHAPATVCCPSRSALLTGVHSYKTGVYGNNNNLRYAPKAKDLVTLPQYFSQHGYISLSMGKIFHRHPIPGDDSGKKNDHGQWAFDEYYNRLGGMGPASSERPVNGLPNLPDEKESYHSTAFDWGPTQYNDETKMMDHLTASWAADQLTNRDFEKPFFMAIGISKPHLKWYVPQKYFDMYPLEDIVLPEVLPEDLEDILDRYGNQAFGPHDTWRRVEEYGRHEEAVRAYLATITFVDDCIGVLLDGLAKSKYADNTIVMLWGDHGWHLGEKMKYGKTQLWQEACRVPMMVKVPGVTPDNKTCNGLVNLIDMYPTLVELCDLPANPANDGRSFAKLLYNPDTVWNEPTLTTMGYGNHRIYDGRYSYINHSDRGVEQLYDHQADSMEWNNLISDPAYSEIKDRLKGYLPEINEPLSPLNSELKPPEPVDTTNKVWIFPGDTAYAWQYDYNQFLGGDVFFFSTLRIQ
jgi:arylsulfatase A-like enzyme